MITQNQASALKEAFASASTSGHIFPAMAACEAMLESAWGTSELAVKAHNVFGCKQASHAIFGTITLPTREDLDGQWIVINAAFKQYATIADAFTDRMATLTRLAPHYPHYAAALAAETPQQYVTEVSRSWSTDPERARYCIAIFDAHQELLT